VQLRLVQAMTATVPALAAIDQAPRPAAIVAFAAVTDDGSAGGTWTQQHYDQRGDDTEYD
jgi:hypothetical protein